MKVYKSTKSARTFPLSQYSGFEFIGVIILIVCCLYLTPKQIAVAESVHIPDNNLRIVLATALGKRTGDDITQSDMASLESFDAFETGIRNIIGLEFAINLKELYLGRNWISDLTPLSGLTNLTVLDLHQNRVIKVVSPLERLTNLTWLSLRGNEILDVSPLKELVRLTYLHVGYNQIPDVNPLKKLTELTFLNLDENNISDISPLKNLTNLTELHVDDNEFYDMSPVKDMTNLTFLNLNDNNILDMSPVKYLTKLTFLDLHGNQITDLSPLKNLKELGGLRFHENSVSDLSPLKDLTKLTFLKLDDNEITDVSPLKNLINLKVLYLSGNHISDFSPIAGLIKNLEKYNPRNQTHPPIISEDVNRDGVVDVIDLLIVTANYHNTNFADAVRFNNYPDVNNDGIVDIKDIIAVAAEIDATSAAPMFRMNPRNISYLSARNVMLWIHLARQIGEKDPYVQRGTSVLVHLYSILTSEENLAKTTALLANYPNPFNPETWIPYQLAEPAEVTISIYNSDGKHIITFELGQLPIGRYDNKSRALHWDGRNEFGESVASGVYFYNFTAGDFTATRKMIIRK